MTATVPLPEASLHPFESGFSLRPSTRCGPGLEGLPSDAGHEGPNVYLPLEPAVDVSIVLPYYNPGGRLRTTVDHALQVLGNCNRSFELILVSDGSTDGSPSTVEDLPEHLVKRICLASNAGKGFALRTGFGMAQGRYIGFIDADGDISPDFIASFLSLMESQEPDIIVGSKRHPESRAQNKAARRLYSWGHQRIVHLLFGLEVRDTQVGIKLASRKAMIDILPRLRERRFSLDLEMLVIARRLGYTNVIEAPVRIEERAGSTVAFKAVSRMLVETLGIFLRYAMRREHEDCALTTVHRPNAVPAHAETDPERAVA